MKRTNILLGVVPALAIALCDRVHARRVRIVRAVLVVAYSDTLLGFAALVTLVVSFLTGGLAGGDRCRMWRRTCAAAMVIMTASAACNSNYMPRSRGRVAVSIQNGQQVYVRDGRVYKNGWLGGGLSEAVAGNPRAVAAARNYHDRLSTGMIGVWVGGAATVGGTVSLAGANSSTTTNQFAGSFVVVIAGLVVMAAGSLYLTSAEPYRWDAINLFNDDADVQTPMPLAPPPGYAPPAANAPSAMKTSLRMRD